MISISTTHNKRMPKGPGDTWKTGQRVPFTGVYVDQFGVASHHVVHATFPPCIGRKGEPAFRLLKTATAMA